MRLTVAMLTVAIFLHGLVAQAADRTVKDKVRVAWQSANLPIHVPMQKSVEIRAPGIPGKPGQLLVLKVQARLDYPANSGWNKFLSVEINGRKVCQSMTGLRNAPQRVLNRDPEWRPAGYEDDYLLFRENQMLVVFAPDFKQFDRRLAHEGEESFWLVLDVGDLILPEVANIVSLSNFAQPIWFANEQHDIILGDLSLGYVPDSLRQAFLETRVRPLPTGKTATGPGCELTLTNEGGMAIKVGREHYLLETSLTWPKGDYNWLACEDRLISEKPQEWQIAMSELSKSGGRLVAEGKFYRLTREIRFDGPRIRVSDKIENLSRVDLGVNLSYTMSVGGPLPDLVLGGDGNPALNFMDETAANPTVFAAQMTSGLGWLAEDDVLRNQLRLRNDRGAVSMYSPGFGLPAGGSYTVRWTLYPGGTLDYWDFINQVRRDWGVNFTIEGPFAFIGHCRDIAAESLDSLRSRFNPRRVRLGTMHPWTNYQYPYDRDQHKAWWKIAQARVRETSAETKCLLMMEPPLESRVHKDHVDQDPYRDAMIINSDGRPGFDLGYGPSYVGQKDHDAGWRLVWRYPTLANSWMKYLEYDVKFAMEECGADGMYIDCFSYAFSRDWARYTHDRWDGHTVDLDPRTHEITAKYADAALLSSPAQKRIVELIQAKGGVVVANSEPATEEMRKVRIFRFVETGSGPQYDRGAHLYTPIALGLPGNQTPGETRARALVADVVRNLNCGALYYYYVGSEEDLHCECVNRMFPFTPRELHAGWLVGEERIITTRSGEFGWGDKSLVNAYRYDLEGRETPLPVKPKVVKGANVYPVEVGRGEIAILERK